MLDDPAKLFNASLKENAMRVIDLAEGEMVDPASVIALRRAAAADPSANRSKK